MLCLAAPEKVSALNLKRLKADNKTCEQPQKPSQAYRLRRFLYAVGDKSSAIKVPLWFDDYCVTWNPAERILRHISSIPCRPVRVCSFL